MQRRVRQMQRSQLDDLNRPNTPGVIRKFLAHTNICIGAASVLLSILLTKSIAIQARPALTNNNAWLHYISQVVQFISGFLLLLIALRFVSSTRSLRRLISAYSMHIQRDIVRQVNLLTALESGEVLAADAAPRSQFSQHDAQTARPLNRSLSCTDNSGAIHDEVDQFNQLNSQQQHNHQQYQQHQQQQIDEFHGEGAHTPILLSSYPTTTVVAGTLLCVVNALLACATAISEVLSTPIVSLFMYSVGARLAEIILVGAILCSIGRDYRLLTVGTQHSNPHADCNRNEMAASQPQAQSSLVHTAQTENSNPSRNPGFGFDERYQFKNGISNLV